MRSDRRTLSTTRSASSKVIVPPKTAASAGWLERWVAMNSGVAAKCRSQERPATSSGTWCRRARSRSSGCVSVACAFQPATRCLAFTHRDRRCPHGTGCVTHRTRCREACPRGSCPRRILDALRAPRCRGGDTAPRTEGEASAMPVRRRPPRRKVHRWQGDRSAAVARPFHRRAQHRVGCRIERGQGEGFETRRSSVAAPQGPRSPGVCAIARRRWHRPVRPANRGDSGLRLPRALPASASSRKRIIIRSCAQDC